MNLVCQSSQELKKITREMNPSIEVEEEEIVKNAIPEERGRVEEDEIGADKYLIFYSQKYNKKSKFLIYLIYYIPK